MTYHITHDPIDQIANLVTKLRTNPDDRRMIVSAWNVADLGDMRLPPCHYVFQCYTRPLSQRERVLYASQQYSVYDLFGAPPDKIDALMDDAGVPRRELSLMLNQRSCDVGLGVPFNIVQYSILLRMLAEVTNMAPGEFIWNGGDIHIYTNHVAGLSEQLDRPLTYPSPTFNFSRVVESIDDFRYDDFVISGYESHARVVLPVAV
jgi:thymidylate synthase